MKRKTAFTVVLLIALGALAACSASRERQSTNETVYITEENSQNYSAEESESSSKSITFIGEEKAKELATARAGLALNSVDFTNVELDEEDGVWKYDVEFIRDNTQYSAQVNAVNGEILSWETEVNN